MIFCVKKLRTFYKAENYFCKYNNCQSVNFLKQSSRFRIVFFLITYTFNDILLTAPITFLRRMSKHRQKIPFYLNSKEAFRGKNSSLHVNKV